MSDTPVEEPEALIAAQNKAEPIATERSATPVVLVVIAVVLAILATVMSLLVSQRNSSNHRDDAERAATYLAGPAAQAAQKAAAAETVATLTYNYKTLSADFAAAEKGLTPHFRANYEKTTAQSVTPLATKYHAVSSASVTVGGGGVSASSETAATVLLFVDQTVQNTQLTAPRLDRSRIKVSMVKVDGHWLINNLLPL